ncbi:MAG: tRNA-dihydrouridine synthase family protein, partial [bacterium]
MNFWNEIKKPIKVLAPMAGYTDSAFRLICHEYGADVVVSELVSSDAIAYSSKQMTIEKKTLNIGHNEEYIFNEVVTTKNQPTAGLLSFFENERPFVVQLFGKHPEKFALATKWIVENLKPDGIDINMGCPARKVVNSDHGAALMKNSDLAVEIVRSVVDNTDLPVSVKTRLGWESDDEILEFAPKLRTAGARTLIIHGRTYKDGFKNAARWENIFKVKEMYGDDLTVIGNGDVQSNVNTRLSQLDGMAIGRAIFGKPWIFAGETIEFMELKKLIIRHATLSFATKGNVGLIEFRKHLLCYLRGFEGAKELRKQAVSVETVSD